MVKLMEKEAMIARLRLKQIQNKLSKVMLGEVELVR